MDTNSPARNRFSAIFGLGNRDSRVRPVITPQQEIISLADHIMQRFSKTDLPEGIFRKSLTTAARNGMIATQDLTAADAATLLKMKVKELNPPIIPVETQQELLSIASRSDGNAEKAKEDYKNALSTLAPEQKTLLGKVLDAALYGLSDEGERGGGAEQTKMSILNLGVVLGPNLFVKLETEDNQFTITALQNKLAEQLLEMRRDELLDMRPRTPRKIINVLPAPGSEESEEVYDAGIGEEHSLASGADSGVSTNTALSEENQDPETLSTATTPGFDEPARGANLAQSASEPATSENVARKLPPEPNNLTPDERRAKAKAAALTTEVREKIAIFEEQARLAKEIGAVRRASSAPTAGRMVDSRPAKASKSFGEVVSTGLGLAERIKQLQKNSGQQVSFRSRSATVVGSGAIGKLEPIAFEEGTAEVVPAATVASSVSMPNMSTPASKEFLQLNVETTPPLARKVADRTSSSLLAKDSVQEVAATSDAPIVDRPESPPLPTRNYNAVTHALDFLKRAMLKATPPKAPTIAANGDMYASPKTVLAEAEVQESTRAITEAEALESASDFQSMVNLISTLDLNDMRLFLTQAGDRGRSFILKNASKELKQELEEPMRELTLTKEVAKAAEEAATKEVLTGDAFKKRLAAAVVEYEAVEKEGANAAKGAALQIFEIALTNIKEVTAKDLEYFKIIAQDYNGKKDFHENKKTKEPLALQILALKAEAEVATPETQEPAPGQSIADGAQGETSTDGQARDGEQETPSSSPMARANERGEKGFGARFLGVLNKLTKSVIKFSEKLAPRRSPSPTAVVHLEGKDREKDSQKL